MAPRTQPGVANPRQSAGRGYRPWLLALGGIVVLVLLGVVVPRMLAWAARQLAVGELRRGAVSSAQQWLARARALNPADARVLVLEAACFRQLRQVRPFVRALETAEKQGAPAAMVAQERTLGLIQAGRFDEAGDRQPAELIAAGFSPHEVAGAFVCGLLVRAQPEEARKALDAWAADFPQHPQVAYTEGIYWQWLGDGAKAEASFRQALALQPRHELARMALAELLEQDDRFAEALEQYARWASDFPFSILARAGLARRLRSMGRLDDARQALGGGGAGPLHPALALEMAQIELERGDLPSARQWLEHVDCAELEDRETLRAAATAFALSDQAEKAAAVFAQADTAYGRARRIEDLRARLAIDPSDAARRGELAGLVGQAQADVAAAHAGASPSQGPPLADVAARPGPANSASDLYMRWCAACHGPEGRGDGPAARHLFPPPRDFHSERFRLVSTANAVPTAEDVAAAIGRGVPGTAMRAFDHLTGIELRQLADEVLAWYRQGIREQLRAAMAAQHEEPDPEELEEAVRLRGTPGPAIEVPPIGPFEAKRAAQGKKTYMALGCAKCHGEDGRGIGELPLADEKGNPCLPRDLALDPFKGGHDPAGLFLRIRGGLPGTPHPACYQVAPQQIVEVVHYCRAIAQEPKRTLTNHQRMTEAAAWRRLDSTGSRSPSPTAARSHSSPGQAGSS